MATKKQRKRRQKDRRHDWEYVYVDEEGHEVEVAEEEPRAKTPTAKAQAKRSGSGGRGGRKVDPPSWRRVGKRALIFAPLMLVVVYLLQGKSKSIPAAVLQTLVLLAFFVPFSYFMDTLMYRSYRKRTGGAPRPR